MIINIIKGYRDIVAVCDSELLGKKFEEEKFQLDLTGTFFKGEEKSEEEIIKIMQLMKKEDATFNIVGKESVKTAIKAGIISKEGVKEIAMIPFGLILL